MNSLKLTKKIAAGDYQTEDERYRVFRGIDIHPPAWDVEAIWTDEEYRLAVDLAMDGGTILDGAASLRDARAIAEERLPEFDARRREILDERRAEAAGVAESLASVDAYDEAIERGELPSRASADEKGDAFRESLAKEGRRLRVPMTHATRDDEWMSVFSYRVDQEIAASERRARELRALRDLYSA